MSTKTRRQQKPVADKKGSSTKENTKNNKSKRDKNGDDGNNDADVYTVEEIRDKKIVRGKPSYLVKWEGYPDDQCTWEPIQNLKSVKDMLDSFDRKFNKKGTSGSEGASKSKPKILKKNQIQMAKKAPEVEETKKRGKQTHSKRDEPPVEEEEDEEENSEDNASPDSSSDIVEISPKVASKTVGHSAKKPSKSAQEPRLQKKVKLNSKESIPSRPAKNNLFEAPPTDDKTNELPFQGHFHYGDKPQRIITAKFESKEGINLLTCYVEWKKRANGVTPIPTPITNYELRTVDPLLLLDYYETRMKIGTESNLNMDHRVRTEQISQQMKEKPVEVAKNLNLSKEMSPEDNTELNSPESLFNNKPAALPNKMVEEKEPVNKKQNVQPQKDMVEESEESKNKENAENNGWPSIVNQEQNEEENLIQSEEKGASTATFDQSCQKPESFIGGAADFNKNVGITFARVDEDEMVIEPECNDPVWATPLRTKTATKLSVVMPSSNKKKLNTVIDEFMAKKKINDDLIPRGEVNNMLEQLKTIFEEEGLSNNQAQVEEEKKNGEQLSAPITPTATTNPLEQSNPVDKVNQAIPVEQDSPADPTEIVDPIDPVPVSEI